MKKPTKDALSAMVYDTIKTMISDGALKPGLKIRKKELSETLGVSQTPVIEALNRLAGEGLIEQRGREGQFVKEFTYEDTRDLFAVRAALEGISLRLCVENLPQERLERFIHLFDGFTLPMDQQTLDRYMKADQRFHEEILGLSGNSVIETFENSFDFIMKTYRKGLIRSPEETLDEHRRIIGAILERNPLEAQELVMRHDLKTRQYIIDTFLEHE